jgi:dihydropteroate synthase
MGIVNVTPDSFSDGGLFLDAQAAVDHALQLVDEGADILDVGGESTRPYSEPVGEREELRRVLPVLEALVRQTEIPLSIDTSKSAVAREALQLGAQIVNDVTGLTGDPRMLETALEHSAAVCAMHMQGTPQTMQDAPAYEDVVAEVYLFLQHRREALLASGVAPGRICLDPGIGFGKTHQHNLTLLANCHRFHGLGCPVLVGASRKGFVAKVLGNKETDRLYGTIGVALRLAAQGVQILRVHDIRPLREALAVFEACGGIDGNLAEIEG